MGSLPGWGSQLCGGRAGRVGASARKPLAPASAFQLTLCISFRVEPTLGLGLMTFDIGVSHLPRLPDAEER
eukprot:379573-Rhodomonas_salina.1